MIGIQGYGVYIPRQRIKLGEINGAWGRSGGRGELAVATRDEDVVTLGLKSAQQALAAANIPADKLGAVYVASVSSGYMESTVAGQIGYALGVAGDVSIADFGLSTRGVTSALRACADAIACGRIEYGLVVGSDRLIARPGSTYELSCAAGAAAILLGRESTGTLAELEESAAYSGSCLGRYRAEGQFRGTTDERFVMEHSYLDQLAGVVEQLSRRDEQTSWDHVVLHAPELKWARRALKLLKLKPESLVSSLGQIGYAGCASFLIDLALALEQARPDEIILAISYGPGGSEAFTWQVKCAPGLERPASAQSQLEPGENISYPTYLRYNGLYAQQPGGQT
mgnify:CR=1 FL=1